MTIEFQWDPGKASISARKDGIAFEEAVTAFDDALSLTIPERATSATPMKKTSERDMLPEYDFSAGVRGKYAARMAKGSNVVVLDKDVQKLFPDSATVNAALRALAQAVAVTHLPTPRTARAKPVARKRAAA